MASMWPRVGAIYPINNLFRAIPAVGLLVAAGAWNTVIPQHERLYHRLMDYAYTYEHPIEKERKLAAQKAKEASTEEKEASTEEKEE